MKREKITKFLKSKLGACIITGVIAFSIGAAGATDVEPLEKTIADNNYTIESQSKQIEELTAKVNEAAPFFEMKAEEQAQVEAQAKKEKEEREAAEKAEAEAKAAAELEAKTKTLSSGNYEAGVDFEAGTYDIIAVSGGGNVSSSNMFSGGINAIMGTEAKIKEANNIGMGDMYQTEYKNIKLPNGTTLSIDGVSIKLVPRG